MCLSIVFLLTLRFTEPPSLLIKGADDTSFFLQQQRYPRFRQALSEKEAEVVYLLADAGLPKQPKDLFIRVFKQTRALEVWMYHPEKAVYVLIKSYRVCSLSGKMGPKRRQGDLQIPEGVYFIDRFNPASSYFLSLGLNYPNASDRLLGHKRDPGNDIFIHGNCVTIGCVPIRDDPIKEVYLLCAAARTNGQRQIPVHIFPAPMTAEHLEDLVGEYPQHAAFWENLGLVYDAFEKTHILPKVEVGADGKYHCKTESP